MELAGGLRLFSPKHLGLLEGSNSQYDHLWLDFTVSVKSSHINGAGSLCVSL